MKEFERIVNDMMVAYNSYDPNEEGLELDYIPGYDDGEGYDPIMGEDEEWIDTDDEWLDDFQGEEEFA